MKKFFRYFALSFAILAFLCLISACGSGNDSQIGFTEVTVGENNGGDEYGEYDSEEAEKPASSAASAEGLQVGSLPSPSSKIIYTYNVSIQTLHYDDTLTRVDTLISQAQGYVEASSQSGTGAIDYDQMVPRWASFTLRVPVDKAESFVRALSDVGAVIQSDKSSEDVTDYYFDTEAHLTALRAQETRLMELLSQADTVDTILAIEDKLAGVRYEIESLEGTMRRLDNQIAYSTVELSVEEVFSPNDIRRTPVSLWERIQNRFKGSIASIKTAGEDLIVFVLGDCLEIILWVGIIIVVATLARGVAHRVKHKRSLGKKKQKRDENLGEFPNDDK